MNPDGVIAGNFRFSLSGSDLNRHWNEPDPIKHAQIFFIKTYLEKITSEGKILLSFCDLHGHGKKNGSFFYGCDKAANGGFCSWTQVRLLPRIMAKYTELFSLRDCAFRVE